MKVLDRRDTPLFSFCIALQYETKILISIFAAVDLNYVSTIVSYKVTDLRERNKDLMPDNVPILLRWRCWCRQILIHR